MPQKISSKVSASASNYSLFQLFLYFFLLGTFGFGGAFTLANSIHKDLVEKKKWITEQEFKHGLALSQFSPGPLVTQLSMYIGYLKQNILGATVAGLAFVTMPFILVLLISIFYVHFGNVVWMHKALYGIGAAVIGMIASSVYSLVKKTVQKKLLWTILLFVFFFSFITGQTNYLIFLGAGILTLFIYTKKIPRVPVNILFPISVTPAVFQIPLMWQLFTFFLTAGSLAFGGGFAILPYLQAGVVNHYHWLTNKQFLDAVAIAMITPGPVVIASVFIGYLVGNIPGALIATLGIFLPIYLIVIFLTPLFKKHATNIYLSSFVEGVVAAAMGSICWVIIVLGKGSITDITTLLLAIGAFVSTRFLRVPSTIVVLCAGIIGILFHW